MAVDGKNFVYRQYTDDDGNTHTLKLEATTAADADYGFGAYSAADPMFIQTPRQYPRSITLMDPNTGRTITRPVGTLTATAWTAAAHTEAVAYPGKAAAVTYTKVRRRGERLAIAPGVVRNLGEPAADV